MTTALLPNPTRLLTLRFGYIASRAIGAAVELDLFTHVQRGSRTLPELARVIAASERGLSCLVDALAVQGLIERRGTELALSPDAALYLVKDSPHFLGGMILQADTQWQRWSRLSEAVQLGRAPESGIESDADGGRYFSSFVEGLYNLHQPAAEFASRRMGPARRILDLGAGSAVWSQAFATTCPDTTVVAVDRLEVLERVTGPYATRAGVQDRYELRAGNIREIDLEDGSFDLVILGHLLHSEGVERSRTLLERVFDTLAPGGRVLIAEMLADEERCHDLYGVLFGLFMLMQTEAGHTFTPNELTRLAGKAGFVELQWLDAPGLYPLLVGVKPG